MTNSYPVLGFCSRFESYPGERLAPIYIASRSAYQNWFNKSASGLSALERRNRILEFMPELVPTYDQLCHAMGGDESTGAFLSLYNPPVFRSGCSQACRAQDNIELVRNYDYPARLSDRMLLCTNWNGTRVIAMTDCLWGVIDGMNEHGLAVSLAYGGRDRRGDGFAITLVLRYLLEFCTSTLEAVAVLQRVPVHMPYNVSLVDRNGVISTVAICPGVEPDVMSLPFATNHQRGSEIMDMNSLADSYSREQFLSARLSDPRAAQASLVSMFMKPPLLRQASQWQSWGTLYTASYQPLLGLVSLHWPEGQVLQQSFDHFYETDIQVRSSAYL